MFKMLVLFYAYILCIF